MSGLLLVPSAAQCRADCRVYLKARTDESIDMCNSCVICAICVHFKTTDKTVKCFDLEYSITIGPS